jgi:hypothetical protein
MALPSTRSSPSGWERPLLSEVLAAVGVPDEAWEFDRTGGHRSSFRSTAQQTFVKLTRPEGLKEMAIEAGFAT